MSSLTSQIYKAARLSATASAVLSGKPSRIAKRGAHIVPECVYWEPAAFFGPSLRSVSRVRVTTYPQPAFSPVEWAG